MGKFVAEMTRTACLLATGDACARSERAACRQGKLKRDRRTFTETKEVIAALPYSSASRRRKRASMARRFLEVVAATAS